MERGIISLFSLYMEYAIVGICQGVNCKKISKVPLYFVLMCIIMYIVIEIQSQKNERNEDKEMKYVVKFELRDEAMGTQNEEEFIPVLILRENELQELLEMYNYHFNSCESYIVGIRVATDEDEAKYPHYYC